MKTSGNPSMEECAEYVKAKANIDEAEKLKFPDAPKAPEARRTVPFGHLRVMRDRPAPTQDDDDDDDDDDDELELEDGGFDMSTDGALTTTTKKKKKTKPKGNATFARGFLN